jgi:hypothetical protein
MDQRMTPARPPASGHSADFLGALAGLVLCGLCACYEDDGGSHARAAEMKLLGRQSFAEAGGRCDDPDECARRQAGFAYARRALVADPDDCPAKGDEDFIDGCQQYGYAIETAVKAARKGF